MVSAIRGGSAQGDAASLNTVRFLTSPHARLSYFVERSSFLRFKEVFMRPEYLRDITIASKIGSDCNKPEARGQAGIRTLSLPWQGMYCTI